MDIIMNQSRSTTQKMHLWCKEWTMPQFNTSQHSMKRKRKKEKKVASPLVWHC